MGVLVLALAIPAVMKKEKKSEPHQEASRLVRVPTEVQRRVIVPPCGTGVSVTTIKPDALAKTAGSVAILLKKGRGDRLVLVPRCRASQGAAARGGVKPPSAPFLLPIGAQGTAGRGGRPGGGTRPGGGAPHIP